ncbi:unnamed protein product [Toxocara canis]|uniref:PITH domain-containing protein n=1 Tax=Toxocara canis TaxID=6265 RepID=A0A183V3M1_TOXCA|nr:unnamed protein product [Toxocara canis]
MSADHSEISTALEVQIPLALEAHGISCASSHEEQCSCALVQNEMVVFKEYNGAKCIKSRIIQLRVRRKQDVDDGGKLDFYCGLNNFCLCYCIGRSYLSSAPFLGV